MNKRITKILFNFICVKKYLGRPRKNKSLMVIKKLYEFIDTRISFDKNSKVTKGINIDKLLDEFEMTLKTP